MLDKAIMAMTQSIVLLFSMAIIRYFYFVYGVFSQTIYKSRLRRKTYGCNQTRRCRVTSHFVNTEIRSYHLINKSQIKLIESHMSYYISHLLLNIHKSTIQFTLHLFYLKLFRDCIIWSNSHSSKNNLKSSIWTNFDRMKWSPLSYYML